ncbi:17-beta-hydroxysteroid dehydrogenase type 1 isoform X1 [Strix uralensis]|uniref:17-beta-hydroxysteroid dehydrogenase type 1 isoform X1 n=2 Tax=Strix uralensis TaxID=36305 RepID=UPI003DA7112F
MERTTVLITGCSSGIGLGLAVRLAADAARRFKVFATMRDLAKGERLLERLGGRCPDTLEVLQLDVTDPRSLAAAAQRVQGQRLDVLGTALPSAPGVAGGGRLRGRRPSPGPREQMPNPGRCRRSWGWDGTHSAGQGCRSWVWGCRGSLAHQQGRGPPVPVLRHLNSAREHEGPRCRSRAVPSSLQRGGGTDGPPGDLLRPGHEEPLRREPLWGRPHHPGLPARHEAPQGRADHRLRQHRGAARWVRAVPRRDPRHPVARGRDPALRVRLCPRAALQLRVLRQQVRGGRAVREPGHRPAALQHPPDAGGVRTRQHQLPGQPAAPGPRGQRAAGAGRRDAGPLPPVPAALPEPLLRRGPGGGRGPAGVPGGHRHPLPAAALRHHPALRPALAPEAGQPRRLRVRGRDARLRVRPRRGRRGPALSGAGGAAASVPAGGLGPAVSPIKPFAAARLPAPSLSLSTLGVPPPPPRAPAG